jgi:diguanylate cyclase (GGDEF)-like protein
MGDRDLGETTGLVERTLSGDEMIFRYGGRLISCIQPGRWADEVRQIMDEFRRLIEKHRFHGPKGINDQKLTVSIGVAGFDPEQADLAPTEIFKVTMECLRRAEADGRNKVVTR